MKPAHTRDASAISAAAASQGQEPSVTAVPSSEEPRQLVAPEEIVARVPDARLPSLSSASFGCPEGTTREMPPSDTMRVGSMSMPLRDPAQPRDLEPRYRLGETLGIGGVGVVLSAEDRVVGRVVALKTLKDGPSASQELAERFLHEARVAGQLEHPNIIPVYDIGRLPDARPYYTMRIVKRQSLQDVLTQPDLRRQWPLVRLVGAFVQISRALAYAHRRGVIHRDIKPENILLGDEGEVYLSDWGNSRVLGTTESDAPLSMPTDHAFDWHRDGSPSGLSGTPGYIAPEQIRGERPKIDHRADIFALGVVLYEMLTGEHPFDAPTVLGVILATQTREPKPPRSISPSCPLVLEDLCMAMLSKDAAKRPPSAGVVAAEAEAFLEGAKERARRREEARSLCELAKEPVERDKALRIERAHLTAEARRLLADVKSYDSVDRKRPAWALEDRASSVAREQARAMAEAIDLYTRALAYDPDLVEARSGLADLYWSRAVMADEERRHASRVYYEALVSEFDVGKYAALLRADAALTVESNPPGARVLAYQYVEKDRVLVASEERYLGRTPLREVRLNPGTYLLVLRRPGYRDTSYPVLLRRGTHHHAQINLYTDEEIGPDFVYVPGGTFVAGGDEDAPDSLTRAEPHVPDFAISRFPVTFRQYCAFLDDYGSRSQALAMMRAPRGSSEGNVVRRNAEGRWEPSPALIEGDARKRFPYEEGYFWNVPVVLVDWFDAAAYCAWRSEREGFEIRLPTELEWEKAARGTDGRVHPWGDHFDPTFCLMRASRPYLPQPEPIGTFPIDESPYGVRDMAGGVREWVADVYGERTWSETSAEPEPIAYTQRDASEWRVLRSGGWSTTPEYTRSASRTRFFALTRASNLGFRVVHSLPRAEHR
ncbi:bifunctional serine/threonine-protein kinase/formylglycine-generating enzyme family protein [Polyangium aurulentum]|uniref:bifunctional serine/threonine-protein kinase/formylglycine-generating enzyme family protein n=1 Tax=Polyangium aurulentum TaxID=2567896 RepID=UPI0010AE6AE4|nr:bifunctional serine/threonine-protein kinase/formylglycine-generating enzyme family protein [Polyangium aurulentum]UQA62322.1 SUMF1/EgtB/PvdO family nonheme iron enzyme [Polyangium aurulentum]